MKTATATSALAVGLLPLLASAQSETVVGAYIFHRHGDRTPKALAPANLTDLGYWQVHTSGAYFRSRYVDSTAALKINGISSDIVRNAQLSVTAPSDTVLQNSAAGFLQGLYPPVGDALGSETLRNGTAVTAPLNGYQLIPVGLVSSGTGSEDSGWLQDASGCGAAISSSNSYFSSSEYQDTLSKTTQFYDNLVPVVNATFAADAVSFKNAYTVWDLINVAEIHNSTIPDEGVLTDDVLFQTRTLADQHEWGLAYNASDPIRAIAGMQLAAEIVQFLNSTITTKGSKKLGAQFGAYATFMSLFGLMNVTAADPDFRGVCDYASALVVELFTNSSSVSASSFPTEDQLNVRFLFHNGTSTNESEPVAYPLFGQSSLSVPWTTFTSEMAKFSVGTTEEWCHACRNTTGTCAAYASSSASSSPSSGSSSGGKKGISTAVGGVIGAMVTLGVVLGLEALALIVFGLRLVRKGRAANAAGGAASPASAGGPEKA